jgi:hypothetical protein
MVGNLIYLLDKQKSHNSFLEKFPKMEILLMLPNLLSRIKTRQATA